MDIKKKIIELPDQPGVYLFKNAQRQVIYIGRATSLHDRVRSYFNNGSHAHAPTRPIEEMLHEVADIDHITTPTIIESVILEAILIRKQKPRYNVMLRDDKSFAYLVITKDEYPQLRIIRGQELGFDWFVDSQNIPKQYSNIFGPFRSVRILETALKILRDIFPYATCKPNQKRSCFYYQIGKCPGVCLGIVSPQAYRRLLRPIILFFEGKKEVLIKDLNKQIVQLAEEEKFEEAILARNQLFALEHIQDIALIQRSYDEWTDPNPLLGRIEGYDISNISGQFAVGSLVVFEAGESKKADYRTFKIKTVKGSNDVAMMAEVLRRRITHLEWPLPDIFLIDGGKLQVNSVHAVLQEANITTPIVGIAKGPTRKKADIVQVGGGAQLARHIRLYLTILLAVRDEAHRFAIQYHRKLRSPRLV